MADMTTNPCSDQLTAVYRDSLIFCVGGGDGLFGTTIQYNSVRIYNTKTNTWSTATNLPITLSMSGGGIIGDTIFVFSGVSAGAYVANSYKGVINPANISTITWTTLPVYPGGAITRMASYKVKKGLGGGIMCSGGAIGGATLSSATYLYNPCTQSWQTLPSNSLARSNFKGAGLNDSVAYIIGGYTTAGTGFSEKITFSQIDGNCLLTSIGNEPPVIPADYSLSQNFPNPFNPTTKIQYSLPKAGLVKLSVFDILGKEINALVNENKVPGSYMVEFNAVSLSSGMYFYKITVNNYSDIKKMLLIK